MCVVVKTIVVVVSLVAAASGNASSPDPNTDRVLRASCRIFAGNARGSGVIFDADEDNYRVVRRPDPATLLIARGSNGVWVGESFGGSSFIASAGRFPAGSRCPR